MTLGNSFIGISASEDSFWGSLPLIPQSHFSVPNTRKEKYSTLNFLGRARVYLNPISLQNFRIPCSSLAPSVTRDAHVCLCVSTHFESKSHTHDEHRFPY
jgi:hypothetical protein